MLATTYYLLFGNSWNSDLQLFYCVNVADEEDIDRLFKALYEETRKDVGMGYRFRRLCEDELDVAEKVKWRRRWAEGKLTISEDPGADRKSIHDPKSRFHWFSRDKLKEIEATHAELSPDFAALEKELAALRQRGATQGELDAHMEAWLGGSIDGSRTGGSQDSTEEPKVPTSATEAVSRLRKLLRSVLDKDDNARHTENKGAYEDAMQELEVVCKMADKAAEGIAEHLEYGLGPDEAGKFETEFRLTIPKPVVCMRPMPHYTPDDVGEDNDYWSAREFLEQAHIVLGSVALKRTDGVAVARKNDKAPLPSTSCHKPLSWQDVKDRLERLRDQGEEYTSQRQLAKRLGCSTATISKAFKSSNSLEAWMALAREAKATPRATALNDVVADNASQATESDPSTVLPDEDVANVFAKLIEDAEPEGRAKLNALNSDERRELVAECNAQEMDNEPSPLDDDPPGRRTRKVKQHKRV